MDLRDEPLRYLARTVSEPADPSVPRLPGVPENVDELPFRQSWWQPAYLCLDPILGSRRFCLGGLHCVGMALHLGVGLARHGQDTSFAGWVALGRCHGSCRDAQSDKTTASVARAFNMDRQYSNGEPSC